MYKIDFNKKSEIVSYYINNSVTLMETARKFNVHYQSVFKWVKKYKSEGGEKALTGYRRPWNRPLKEFEQKVALLKERKPKLTVRKAKEILEKQGIKISVKGIWGIWKRYALTNRPSKNPYLPFGHETKESQYVINLAKKYIEEKKVEEAALLLNDLPSCPDDPVLLQVPEKMLSPRRRLERLCLEMRKIPFPEYSEKAERIQNIFEYKKMYYSALMAGFQKLLALQWMLMPEEELQVIRRLKKYLPKREVGMKFVLLIEEAKSYAVFLKGKKARKALKTLKNITHYVKNPLFLFEIANMYTYLHEFKEAFLFYKKAMQNAPHENARKSIAIRMAVCFAIMGKYKESLSYLKVGEKNKRWAYPLHFLTKSFVYFGKGKLFQIPDLLEKVLKNCEKDSLYNYLQASCFLLSSYYRALNRKRESLIYLKKYISVMKRFKMYRDIYIRKMILEEGDGKTLKNIFQEKIPFINLLILLKRFQKYRTVSNYNKIFEYAQSKGLMGLFHRTIIFFPHIINYLINKGKPTYLPKSILKLPVFNKNAFVFDVRFLGRLKVYRSYGGESEKSKVKSKKLKVEGDRLKELLRLNLTPKEKAFLIHLALRLPEPGRTISLEKIYKNFWRDSKKPERNLSHLLTKIRKQLKIPVHLLEISRRGGYPVLKNNGIYFITDYLEFKEKVARARALLRAEEYEFAKREFKSALKLVRGEPFKKMYDTWSEDKRTEILVEIESAKEDFEKEGERCKE